ncbi:unnamed protein product [marine sediment metagenome]|uniref:HEPN domain-containing protein n=1 Tax=marine sediment metagenome TaxID=412755 RepID=X1H8F0_9ZZZZ
MNPEFERCLRSQKIKAFSRGKMLADKELKVAASDLEQAKITFEDDNYKWATIQCYYSMFHSARALLYIRNYRERSHHCLIVAIRVLYVEKKLLPLHLIEGLQKAKTLRESADYYDQWSKMGVETILKIAEEFLNHSIQLIKEMKK